MLRLLHYPLVGDRIDVECIRHDGVREAQYKYNQDDPY